MVGGGRSFTYSRRLRARSIGGLICALVALPAGCMPSSDSLEDDALDVLTLMEATPEPGASPPASSAGPCRQITHLSTIGIPVVLSGELNGERDYELFACGAGKAGDRWMVQQPLLWPGERVVVALFDESMQLLARSSNAAANPLIHVLRRDNANVFVGVTAGCEETGDAYVLRLSRAAGAQIPLPRPQVVWLNFAGVSDLTIGTCKSLSFGPFDAARIGDCYTGTTAEIKQAIADAVLRNYADYNLFVLNSDETPEPPEPYTTIHVGGYGEAQLGVADNVDAYNADPQQNAIVFVESFAPYWTMHLSPGQMGRMIGNVASHELGHLLGLYHVYEAGNLMAEAAVCTAWDLANQQDFEPADLDPCVFPTGRLDASQLLEDTLGLRIEPLPPDMLEPPE